MRISLAQDSTGDHSKPPQLQQPDLGTNSESNNKEAQMNLNLEQSIDSGIKLYSEKNYPQALDRFVSALKKDSLDIRANFNLGLTYFQLARYFEAIAFFRRSIDLDGPSNEIRTALSMSERKAEIREIAHQMSIWESFRKNTLPFLNLNFIFLMALVLFVTGNWTLINFFIKKKNVKDTDNVSWPIFSTLSLIFFFLFIGLAGSKIYDQSTPHATVIKPEVSVYSAPGENQTKLFELFGGLEVQILNSDGQSWIQIYYPGGLVGWVKATEIIQSSALRYNEIISIKELKL